MPFMSSSPVAYPPTSSPPQESPRKKRKLFASRDPLAELNGNERGSAARTVFDDESEDEDEFAAVKAAVAKRKQQQTTQTVKTLTNERAESPPLETYDAGQSLFDSTSQDSLSNPVSDATSQEPKKPLTIRTSFGRSKYIGQRDVAVRRSYEQVIANRSVAVEGRARRSYYGVNIHNLLDEETQESALRTDVSVTEQVQQSIERPIASNGKQKKTLMWTEKYRARKFTDLIGDERTHRSVLRWLKAWDHIVFPTSVRPKAHSSKGREDADESQLPHKILLLTGPPGLGKTTLAHVCARQAGYEVSEINASDERSKNVVKNRIQTMVATENVRSIDTKTSNGKIVRAVRPLCIVVDEVDGVVTGNSEAGGEGGFIKALVELVQLDQKNSQRKATMNTSMAPRRKGKGDSFCLQRPIILICNDVYHPSLRPLRQAGIAQVIHARKPPLNMIVSRTQSIFEREGIPCDGDAARRLCEATWGVSSRKDGGSGSGPGEGDIRGIMVISEWVATKLRASSKLATSEMRLTRSWIEEHLLNTLSQDGAAMRAIGRGNAKEIVDRIFLDGGGFPKTAQPIQIQAITSENSEVIGVAEVAKRRVLDRLQKMIDTSGETDKIMTDCFTNYPTSPYQDDTFLSKPVALYDWLYFHDALSSAVFSLQEWELQPYLSSSVLAFHHLFASPARHRPWDNSTKNKSTKPNEDDEAAGDDPSIHPFTGPGAPYAVSEAHRQTTDLLSTIQPSLTPPLSRLFRSPDTLATELAPYLARMLAPNITPVIINNHSTSSSTTASGPTSTATVRRASEKACVARAVEAMRATGVTFARTRLEAFDDAGGPGMTAGSSGGGWIYRMEPAVDELATYATGGKAMMGAVRYGVRQVLEAEWRREEKRVGEERRAKRWAGGGEEVMVEERVEKDEKDKEKAQVKGRGLAKGLKRDFFGRLVPEERASSLGADGGSSRSSKKQKREVKGGEAERVWVSFHEGYSNAVRKPITIEELMRGL